MVYLASPYSHTHAKVRLYRYNLITKITGELQDRYPYAFIGPITQSHNTAQYMINNNTEFTAWIIRDFTYISHCNELWVIMIDGWQESKGIQEELLFAKTQKIKIKYFDPLLFKFIRSPL